MPNGLMPTEGIGDLCEYILKRSISGVLPWRFRFWVNDLTPTVATTADQLVWSTFGGFTPFDLSRDEWTVPVVTGGCAVSTWGTDVQSWTVTGGPIETIYGYAFVDPTLNVLRFVQRFDAADIRPVEIGKKVKLLPRYTLSSCACP